MCAELLPELIELDEWGFPILRSKEVPPSLLEHAKRAERLCPTLAVIIKQS
jgi:ferredoxin